LSLPKLFHGTQYKLLCHPKGIELEITDADHQKCGQKEKKEYFLETSFFSEND